MSKTVTDLLTKQNSKAENLGDSIQYERAPLEMCSAMLC